MTRTLALFAVVGHLLSASSGAAQDLERVESLALSGQAEEAREVLTGWWEENFDGGTRLDRQKGLWLRGLLTVAPDLAELDFQRLVVEYPGGPFTAEALVRLGRAAEARNKSAAAEQYFRTLLRDYPGSRYETVAQAWLGSRAATLSDVSSVSDAGAEATPGSREAASPVSGAYSVQLGAFSQEAGALRLSGAAERAGLVIRVVRVEGNSLFRVRVGRFATEEEAVAEMARVVDSGFEATVVKNADREGS